MKFTLKFKRFVVTVLATAFFALGALSPAFANSANSYDVDAAHSSVGFVVKHLVSKVNGNFNEFEGKFNFDPAKVSDSKVEFKIKTASINTNNGKRDEHLRSPDFFDVAKFPEITFVSKKVTAKGKKADQFVIEGDMTMHGVTKAVAFETDFEGIAKDPFGGTRAGFTATSKINRKDFGILWNKVLDKGSLLLGEEVTLVIHIEAIQQTQK